MELTYCLLFLLSNLHHLILAAPTASHNSTLGARQVLTSNPQISCCTTCTAAYGPTKWNNVFDNFCTWAGGYLELWTTERYYSDNYCVPGGSRCIIPSIQYMCGQPYGNTGAVTYEGCMGYFTYVRNPHVGCGGPPFSGARIESSDGCWIFQATADQPIPADTAPGERPSPHHEFGDPIQVAALVEDGDN